MVGQWLVPTSLRSSLHGPGCKMNIRTFLDREFEHQMNDCAVRLGVGSSPKTVSTHCSSHMNMAVPGLESDGVRGLT